MIEDNDITGPLDIAEIPEEMDHNKNVEQVDRSACRDATTGRFTKGWKGGGRPQGSRDRFSKRVLDTLEACWEANADEMLQQLSAEDPKVIMGMIARLLPQAVITEDLTGEAEKAQGNQEVTVRVVTQQHQDVLPPREVVGELVDENDSQHISH